MSAGKPSMPGGPAADCAPPATPWTSQSPVAPFAPQSNTPLVSIVSPRMVVVGTSVYGVLNTSTWWLPGVYRISWRLTNSPSAGTR